MILPVVRLTPYHRGRAELQRRSHLVRPGCRGHQWGLLPGAWNTTPWPARFRAGRVERHVCHLSELEQLDVVLKRRQSARRSGCPAADETRR